MGNYPRRPRVTTKVLTALNTAVFAANLGIRKQAHHEGENPVAHLYREDLAVAEKYVVELFSWYAGQRSKREHLKQSAIEDAFNSGADAQGGDDE